MNTEAAATCDETGPGDAGTPPSEITGAQMSRALSQRDANLPGAGALTKWGHGMERGSWPCSCVQDPGAPATANPRAAGTNRKPKDIEEQNKRG